MPARRLRVRGHVLTGNLGDDAGLDPEEAADPVQGLGGPVHQVPIAVDQNLLAGEQGEQVRQLLAVPAEPAVVPERRPARLDPPPFLLAGPQDVADRLQPGRPQVRPVGVGPLHRVTQHHDEPGVGDSGSDAPLRGQVVEVERGGFAGQRARRSGVEKGLVVLSSPDVLAVCLDVAGTTTGRGRAVGQEEFRFLHR